MIYKLSFEEEARERFRLIQEDINHGIELRGEDKAFYDEFKPKMEKESLSEGSTFWEGEADGTTNQMSPLQPKTSRR